MHTGSFMNFAPPTAPEPPLVPGQVWVHRTEGERVVVAVLPEGRPDRVLLTYPQFADHPPDRRPQIAMDVGRFRADFRPEDAPAPAPPATEIGVGSTVVLKARCPSTPRMTVLRVYDSHFDTEPYTVAQFADVAYVPAYGDGDAGVIRKDKFPLACLESVTVHPRDEE